MNNRTMVEDTFIPLIDVASDISKKIGESVESLETVMMLADIPSLTDADISELTNACGVWSDGSSFSIEKVRNDEAGSTSFYISTGNIKRNLLFHKPDGKPAVITRDLETAFNQGGHDMFDSEMAYIGEQAQTFRSLQTVINGVKDGVKSAADLQASVDAEMWSRVKNTDLMSYLPVGEGEDSMWINGICNWFKDNAAAAADVSVAEDGKEVVWANNSYGKSYSFWNYAANIAHSALDLIGTILINIQHPATIAIGAIAQLGSAVWTWFSTDVADFEVEFDNMSGTALVNNPLWQGVLYNDQYSSQRSWMDKNTISYEDWIIPPNSVKVCPGYVIYTGSPQDDGGIPCEIFLAVGNDFTNHGDGADGLFPPWMWANVHDASGSDCPGATLTLFHECGARDGSMWFTNGESTHSRNNRVIVDWMYLTKLYNSEPKKSAQCMYNTYCALSSYLAAALGLTVCRSSRVNEVRRHAESTEVAKWCTTVTPGSGNISEFRKAIGGIYSMERALCRNAIWADVNYYEGVDYSSSDEEYLVYQSDGRYAAWMRYNNENVTSDDYQEFFDSLNIAINHLRNCMSERAMKLYLNTFATLDYGYEGSLQDGQISNRNTWTLEVPSYITLTSDTSKNIHYGDTRKAHFACAFTYSVGLCRYGDDLMGYPSGAYPFHPTRHRKYDSDPYSQTADAFPLAIYVEGESSTTTVEQPKRLYISGMNVHMAYHGYDWFGCSQFYINDNLWGTYRFWMQLGEYTASSFKAAAMTAAAIAAVAAVAIAVGSIKFRKWKNRREASLRAKKENAAWNQATNPSADNLAAMVKAERAYDRNAAVFGWSTTNSARSTQAEGARITEKEAAEQKEQAEAEALVEANNHQQIIDTLSVLQSNQNSITERIEDVESMLKVVAATEVIQAIASIPGIVVSLKEVSDMVKKNNKMDEDTSLGSA